MLQQRKMEQGLMATIGTKDQKPHEGHEEGLGSHLDIPLAQLVQTNVTRFGTIIMITFLVSILTPLYRYNIR